LPYQNGTVILPGQSHSVRQPSARADGIARWPGATPHRRPAGNRAALTSLAALASPSLTATQSGSQLKSSLQPTQTTRTLRLTGYQAARTAAALARTVGISTPCCAPLSAHLLVLPAGVSRGPWPSWSELALDTPAGSTDHWTTSAVLIAASVRLQVYQLVW